MELGNLNRALILRALWRGTLIRLLLLVAGPWCLTMGLTSANWEGYAILGMVAAFLIAAFRSVRGPT